MKGCSHATFTPYKFQNEVRTYHGGTWRTIGCGVVAPHTDFIAGYMRYSAIKITGLITDAAVHVFHEL